MGEAKPALSIAFSVADAQGVLLEHESIGPATDTVTVGGAVFSGRWICLLEIFVS